MWAAVAISIIFAVLLAYILYLKKRDLDRAKGNTRQASSRRSVSKERALPPPASKEMLTVRTSEIAITSPRDQNSPKADTVINGTDGISKNIADKKDKSPNGPLIMDVNGKAPAGNKVGSRLKKGPPSLVSAEIKSVQEYIQKKQIISGKNSFLDRFSLRAAKTNDVSVTLKSHRKSFLSKL